MFTWSDLLAAGVELNVTGYQYHGDRQGEGPLGITRLDEDSCMISFCRKLL
jgi:hypothetical protein